MSASKITLAAAALVAVFGSGCGNIQSDRIDAICECQRCGDREQQEVEIIVTSQYDVAEAYGCIEALEPYWACELERHECRDGNYNDNNDDCDSELQNYMECANGRSTREPGPY